MTKLLVFHLTNKLFRVDPEDPVTEGSLGETVFQVHLVDLVLLVTGVKMADLAEM